MAIRQQTGLLLAGVLALAGGHDFLRVLVLDLDDDGPEETLVIVALTGVFVALVLDDDRTEASTAFACCGVLIGTGLVIGAVSSCVDDEFEFVKKNSSGNG